MSGYYYMDVSLKLETKPEEILPIYFKSCIVNSLNKIFGEIGGLTTIDLLKFDEKEVRGILRVPEDSYIKVRAALTLTGTFQDIPCRFYVHCASPVLLSLIRTQF